MSSPARTPLENLGDVNSICKNYKAVLQSPDFSATSPIKPLNNQSSSSYINHSLHQSSSSYVSAYSAMPSAASQTSFDLLQAKIEHLERERVELSLQLHQQSEKERTKKLQMERMEASLKSVERDKEVMLRSLEDAQTTAKSLKDENEHLMVGSKKLQEQIVAQKTAASIASREIKRLEDDLVKVKVEKTDILQEKEHLTAAMTGLQETNGKQKEEMAMVRLEMEFQQQIYTETKRANDTEMTALKEEYHATHSALVAAISTHEHDMETLVREKHSMVDEIVELKKQLVVANTGSRRPKQCVGEDNVDMDNEDDDIADLGLTEALTLIETLKKKLLQSELKRKQLHNTLQELRGNIRVFVRCRPFLRGKCPPLYSPQSSCQLPSHISMYRHPITQVMVKNMITMMERSMITRIWEVVYDSIKTVVVYR